MKLIAEKIYQKLKNSEIDRNSAINLLIHVLENSEKVEQRLECLKIIELINESNEELFNMLENILISDSNAKIKINTARTMKKLFKSKVNGPLMWAISNEKSINCLISFISILSDSDDYDVKEFLMKKFVQIRNKKYKYNLKDLVNEQTINEFSNQELGELLINYYLISTLKLHFGYMTFKIDEQGTITELDLSNLDIKGVGVDRISTTINSILSLSFLKK